MKAELKKINYVWSKNGNNQIIQSPHKTFNKLSNFIDNSCNLIANTQTSYIIRAFYDTKCNGLDFKQGELQKKDIEHISPIIKNDLLFYIQQQDKNDKFRISNFYIYDLFCSFIYNLNTKELKIFDYSKNYKQKSLINWLKNYLYEII